MQTNHPGASQIGLSSVKRRLVMLAVAACVGALTLSACGDGKAASSPTTVAPPTVSPAPAPAAPSKASRDGGDGRGEAADESAEPTEGAADPFGDVGGLVRGLGPRGHDAR